MSSNMEVVDVPVDEEEEVIDEFLIAFEAIDEDSKDPSV